MQKSTLFFAAAVALVGAASASSYHYYPTEAPKKCYAIGERCIGATNHPAVEYLPCCGEASCTKKDMSYGGYGHVCEHAPKCAKKGEECGAHSKCCGKLRCTKVSHHYGHKHECAHPPTVAPTTTKPLPRCRPEGEKCIGAYGYPAVAWVKCCEGYSCVGKAKDWGLVCAKPAPPAPKCMKKGEDCSHSKKCCGKLVCIAFRAHYGHKTYECAHPPTMAPTTTTKPSPKCRPAGEKCAGAPGYPAVPWVKCCKGYKCVGKAKDWGLVCAKPAPPAPKCMKKGEDCSHNKKCCGQLVCTAFSAQYGHKKYECAYPPTAPPTTTTATMSTTMPVKCAKKGEGCGEYSSKCCGKLECSKVSHYYGHKYECAYPPTAAPTTTMPLPKCRPEGEKCAGASGYPAVAWVTCCKGYSCVGKAKDWGLVCAKPAPPAPSASPAPKCIKQGEKCSKSNKCCDTLECAQVPVYGGYGYRYECMLSVVDSSPAP